MSFCCYYRVDSSAILKFQTVYTVRWLAKNVKMETSTFKRYLICSEIIENPTMDSHYLKK